MLYPIELSDALLDVRGALICRTDHPLIPLRGNSPDFDDHINCKCYNKKRCCDGFLLCAPLQPKRQYLGLALGWNDLASSSEPLSSCFQDMILTSI